MSYARFRSAEDCETVVNWLPNAEALYLFTGPRLSWPLDAMQLAELERTPGYGAWMLVDDEVSNPVGHFDITIENGIARLGRVLVGPQQRGRGYGRALVELAVRQAEALGAAELRLNVIAGNEAAEHIYLRVGFVDIASTERPDVRTMSLRL